MKSQCSVAICTFRGLGWQSLPEVLHGVTEALMSNQSEAIKDHQSWTWHKSAVQMYFASMSECIDSIEMSRFWSKIQSSKCWCDRALQLLQSVKLNWFHTECRASFLLWQLQLDISSSMCIPDHKCHHILTQLKEADVVYSSLGKSLG